MKPAAPRIVYVDVVHDYPVIGGVVGFSKTLFEQLQARYGARMVSALALAEAEKVALPGTEITYPSREAILMHALAARHPQSVFFVPNLQAPVPRRPGVPRPMFVNVVHDIQHRYLPDNFPPSTRRLIDEALQSTVANSDKVLFVSETSRAQFTEHFGKPRRSRVVYAPVAGEAPAVPAAPAERPFLMSSSHFTSQHRHKNAAGVLKLFAALAEKIDGLELRLTGHADAAFETAVAQLSDGLRQRVRPLGFISRGEMDGLYAQALAFVSLSFFEGFNMSAGEAAAHRTPMILSDLPVHRELYSHGMPPGAACFVDPAAPSTDAVLAWLAAYGPERRAAPWPLRDACRPEAVARRVAQEIDEMASKLKPAALR